MKCLRKGWCCDKADNNECVAAEDFECPDKVTENEYHLIHDPGVKRAADYADRRRSGSGSY